MLFILSMTASLMLIPSGSRNYFTINRAQHGHTCMLDLTPTGIGQPVTVGFWLSLPPPDASGPYGGQMDGHDGNSYIARRHKQDSCTI